MIVLQLSHRAMFVLDKSRMCRFVPVVDTINIGLVCCFLLGLLACLGMWPNPCKAFIGFREA